MNITLRQMQYLLALQAEGSFGRAAEQVHISQPALSIQIKELETTLGVQLVERDRRGVIFTPAGVSVLEHAQKIMSEVRAIHEVGRWANGLHGRLSVGVIPTIAPYLLPAALPLLRMQNIHLDLRIREARTQYLLEDLREGRLDAAVMALPVDHEGFESNTLFEDCFLLAGSQERINALGDRQALRPTDLDPDSLLLLEEGHCLADQALEVCNLTRQRTRVDLGASSLSTLTGLAQNGFGLTFVPELAVAQERRTSPDLAFARFPAPEPRRVIGLVRRQTSRGEGWFHPLSDLLTEAGETVISHARRAFPA